MKTYKAHISWNKKNLKTDDELLGSTIEIYKAENKDEAHKQLEETIKDINKNAEPLGKYAKIKMLSGV